MASPVKATSSLILLLVGAFLVWASVFEVDQTVRAQGQVIPEKRTQVIQVADGGVLAALHVSEGQEVKAGDVIAVLEKDRAVAGVEEGRARLAALEATFIRAQAEAQVSEPDFGNLAVDYPDIVAAQEALFIQNRQALQDEASKLEDGLEVARSEWSLHQDLLETGDVSQVEVMRLQRQVLDLEGRLSAARHRYATAARKEMTQVQDSIAIERFKLDQRNDILDHTNIVAPVAGVVKYLRINTLGGVLRQGDELMQISPTGGDLIIETKISPADIAQLELGLPATVKLDAYDYTVYGALEGTLEYISSDTLTEQGPEGQSAVYYRAHVYVQQNQINPKLKSESLKPGMTAAVDVQIDKRSVLRYIAKPVLRAFDGALTQK